MTEKDFIDHSPTGAIPTVDNDVQPLGAEQDPMNVTDVSLLNKLGANGLYAVGIELSTESPLPHVDTIPSLLALLSGPESAHQHKYSDDDSVFRISCDAEDTPEGERTEAQKELLNDLEILGEFAPSNYDMQYVYTPAELHQLIEKFQLLRQKNRPDFNDVEGELVDFVLRHKTIMDKRTVNGIVKREREDSKERRGMQWSTLTTVASAANVVMASRLQTGQENKRYVIHVDRDPDASPTNSKALNLQSVYQFVALSHAYSVIDARNSSVTPSREQTFLKNAEVIEGWYSQVSPALGKLPTDRNWLAGSYDERGRTSGIKLEIDFLKKVLDDRRDSDVKFGTHKSYTQNPVGAINAQLRLGHIIEDVRAKLTSNEQATQEDIIPLDIDALL